MRKAKDKIAASTRGYRKLHRLVAVPLFVFMFLIGATGLLLGWKKQANLTPPTGQSLESNPANWLPLDSLLNLANQYADQHLAGYGEIDRMDIRPKKGIAKVVFTQHYAEIQLDCATGRILFVGKRWNDFVEHLHDGTIVDRLLGFKGDSFKITYTTITSLGLMGLAFSGFWLWFNPKRIKSTKSKTIRQS